MTQEKQRNLLVVGVLNGHLLVVKFLMSVGVDPLRKDKFGKSARDYAIEQEKNSKNKQELVSIKNILALLQSWYINFNFAKPIGFYNSIIIIFAMLFSLTLRRIMNRRTKGDMYAYRKKYLIACLIMGLIFLITATVLLCLHIGTYLYISLYVYGGLEIIIALIVFCRLQSTPKKDNVIVINQSIPLQSGRTDNNPYVSNNQNVNQTPLIGWYRNVKYNQNSNHLHILTFLLMML